MSCPFLHGPPQAARSMTASLPGQKRGSMTWGAAQAALAATRGSVSSDGVRCRRAGMVDVACSESARGLLQRPLERLRTSESYTCC